MTHSDSESMENPLDYTRTIAEVLKAEQCALLYPEGAFNLLLSMATSDDLMGNQPTVKGSRPIIHPSFVQSYLTLLENHMQRIVEMPVDTLVMVSNDIDRSKYDKSMAVPFSPHGRLNILLRDSSVDGCQDISFYFMLDLDEDVDIDKYGRATRLRDLYAKMMQNIIKSRAPGPVDTILLDIFDAVPRWAVRLPKWLHHPTASKVQPRVGVEQKTVGAGREKSLEVPVVDGVASATIAAAGAVRSGDIDGRLSAIIDVANDAARMARRARRSGVVPGPSPAPDRIQRYDRAVSPPEKDPHPNRRQRRSMEVMSSHGTRLHRRKAMHEKEATRAFLKQCGPALLKEGSSVHGEAQPEFIENRLRASLKKVERVSKQKEKMQNLLEERKKIAEIFGV